jgi:hypothetical protein
MVTKARRKCLTRVKEGGSSMTEFNSCPDCGVSIGDIHQEGCDISRCKIHGNQLLKCLFLHESNDCRPTKFSGYFPGTEEAIERGWFSYLDKTKTWIKCEASHPEASPDINKVLIELEWNSEQEKFV